MGVGNAENFCFFPEPPTGPGVNSLVGSVPTTDGRQVRLSTFAQVEFIFDGPLIELSQLEVRYRG